MKMMIVVRLGVKIKYQLETAHCLGLNLCAPKNVHLRKLDFKQKLIKVKSQKPVKRLDENNLLAQTSRLRTLQLLWKTFLKVI